MTTERWAQVGGRGPVEGGEAPHLVREDRRSGRALDETGANRRPLPVFDAGAVLDD
jgi:hypothetical protein